MSNSTNNNQSCTNSENPTIESTIDLERSNKKDIMTEIFGDVIYSYSRSDALSDGVLIDVTETAQEAGFVVPVALTINAYNTCVSWPSEEEKSGRLWDVLFMANHEIRTKKTDGDTTIFSVCVVPLNGDASNPVKTKLKMMIGGGDQGEPVITIMLPNED